jgi:hypothetical protein
VIAALVTLVTVALLVLGAVACTYIRARAVRTGHLADIAREIIGGWRR